MKKILEKNQIQYKLFKKFSRRIMAFGFTAIPNLLLWHQKELELSKTEIWLIANIFSYYWMKGRNPYPSLNKIKNQSKVSERTIHRAKKSLIKKKYLIISKQKSRIKTNYYDFSPLIKKLDEIAIREIEEKYKNGTIKQEEYFGYLLSINELEKEYKEDIPQKERVIILNIYTKILLIIKKL